MKTLQHYEWATQSQMKLLTKAKEIWESLWYLPETTKSPITGKQMGKQHQELLERNTELSRGSHYAISMACLHPKSSFSPHILRWMKIRKIQRRLTKQILQFNYMERQNKLVLCSLQKKWLTEDILKADRIRSACQKREVIHFFPTKKL